MFADALRLATPGPAVGAVLALLLALLLRTTWHVLHPIGPADFVVGAAVVLGVFMLASMNTARRAAGMESVEALRTD